MRPAVDRHAASSRCGVLVCSVRRVVPRAGAVDDPRRTTWPDRGAARRGPIALARREPGRRARLCGGRRSVAAGGAPDRRSARRSDRVQPARAAVQPAASRNASSASTLTTPTTTARRSASSATHGRDQPGAQRPARRGSRQRSDAGSVGGLEHIPRAAHGVDHRRPGRRRSSCAGRRCTARRRWPGRRSRSSTPGRGSAPCDSTRRGLRIRKRSSSNSVAVSVISVAAAADLVAVLVQHQVADDELAVGAAATAAPARRSSAAQPGHDLLQAERLGHVVVAAGGQPGDPVLDGVLRGQEQHRHVRGVRAQPAQHLQAVDVGQHHVEHHHVRPELAGRAHGASARRRRCAPPSPRSAAPSTAARPAWARRRRPAPGPGCRRGGATAREPPHSPCSWSDRGGRLCACP